MTPARLARTDHGLPVRYSRRGTLAPILEPARAPSLSTSLDACRVRFELKLERLPEFGPKRREQQPAFGGLHSSALRPAADRRLGLASPASPIGIFLRYLSRLDEASRRSSRRSAAFASFGVASAQTVDGRDPLGAS